MTFARPLLFPVLLASSACFADTVPPIQQDDGFIATDFLHQSEPKPRVLLLGIFHFDDAGLDVFKPKIRVDIESPERQAELADVLARLAAFKPTKIAIEADAGWQPKADERYAGYLAGTYLIEAKPNEIYQVGFRLGKLAGLTHLNCIDVMGRDFPGGPKDMDEVRAYVKAHNEEQVLDDGWLERFTKLYEHDDELKTQMPLRNYLLYINSPERLRMGHGHYVTGMFKVGAGDNYMGADKLAGYWYARNLRIFANILRLADRPEERIVVILGAGHLPILRHLAQASPEIELVEVRDVLGAP